MGIEMAIRKLDDYQETVEDFTGNDYVNGIHAGVEFALQILRDEKGDDGKE
mgnify:CR=1 FL=1